MIVAFDKSFSKSLDKLKDAQILPKIEKIIIECETASALSAISNVKKLVGFKTYYRIKIGDYRLGFELLNNEITFITVKHRKDIYKKFP